MKSCHLLTIELTIEEVNTTRVGGGLQEDPVSVEEVGRLDGRGGGIGILELGHEAKGARPHSSSLSVGGIGDPGGGRANPRGSAEGEVELAWPPDPRGHRRAAAVGLGARPLGFRLWRW
jgi:hypothetical protein